MTDLKSSFNSYKKSPYASIKHSTYFDVYDRLFNKYVGKEITFVEIGVLNGGSLFMWRDFFGDKARIIGIDLNPGAKRWEEAGFEIHIGSQSDEKFWEKFIEDVGNIDVLLDDGGHTYHQQIVTIDSTLSAINDGGLIVVEDTHTSYMAEYGGPGKYSFLAYAKNIIDGINYRSGTLQNDKSERQIYGISFYESFVVFDINRAKSTISESTSNSGKFVDAQDFRYGDANEMSALGKSTVKYAYLRNIPYLRKILKFCYVAVLNVFLKKNLKKYFKY